MTARPPDPPVLTAARAAALIARFADSSVLVVGDVMLDQFLVGRVHRLSPEAPVPIVEHDHDEYRVGGAANVAHTIRALGGRVGLHGVIGQDAAGARVTTELDALGIGTEGLVTDPGRRTTLKVRIVTDRNQQVGRIDYETDSELAADLEAALLARVEPALAGAHVIVVSDYLKGVVTRGIMTRLVARGRARGLPVLVDPKIPHLDYYTGATLVTPNHHEAEIATHQRIRSAREAGAAARAVRARAGCEAVLITRGEHGMCLLEGPPRHDAAPAGGPDEQEVHLGALAREVADVTGAGDTVIGTISLALAAGATLTEAAVLANHGAGIVVGKFGPSTVASDELLQSVSRAAPGGSSG